MFDTSFFEKEAEHDHDHDDEGAPEAKFVETSAMKYPYEPHRETARVDGEVRRARIRDTVTSSSIGTRTPADPGCRPSARVFSCCRRASAARPYRATDATIFCAVEGRGTSTIGEKTFGWGPRDIFVAPSWHPVSHQTQEEAVLFSFSDRPAQKALGIWREDC